MSKQTFAERCQLAQQLLPDAQYRAMLTKLHAEMLAALAEQPAQQKPACFNGLVDTDGENKALRCLLMLYGERGLTVGAMKTHLSMSGFKMWPDWVEREPDGAHLTKSGAQLWIRHLFSLEQPAQQEPIYQCQDSTGKWTDQTKHSYDYNVKQGSAVVRVVYTTPQAPKENT